MLNGTTGLLGTLVEVTNFFAGGEKKRTEIRPAATDCDCACDDCYCDSPASAAASASATVPVSVFAIAIALARVMTDMLWNR